MRDSQSGVGEDSNLLGCDNVLFG